MSNYFSHVFVISSISITAGKIEEIVREEILFLFRKKTFRNRNLNFKTLKKRKG